MFKNVILFAHKAGQRKVGVDMTPEIIKPHINPKCFTHNTKVSDSLKNNLYNLYQKNLLIKGNRVNIGGDHSMSIATVANSLDRYSNLRVIWMDAHCDINTFDESDTKNYHGMPISILTGLENDKSLNFSKNKLNFKNILYVGIRDIDPFEQMIVEKYNINYITIDQIHSNIKKSLEKIHNFSNNKPIHFSFDVDVLDPFFMPSTGTPVNGGLDLEKCKIIVDNMLDKNLISVDITELNLNIGCLEDKTKSLNNLKFLFDKYIF